METRRLRATLPPLPDSPAQTARTGTADLELPILRPRPHRFSATIADGLSGRHPVTVFVTTALAGTVLLSLATIAVGLLLTSVLTPSHGVGHSDEHVNVWLAAHRTPARDDASLVLSGIGDVYAIPALVSLVTVTMACLRRWRVAGFVLAAIAAKAAIYRVTTLAVHRQRPDVPRLDDLPANASYYSGHAAAAVAVYAALALLVTSRVRTAAVRIPVWLAAISIPLLVGLARMYRGMHHPSDVAVGLLVGAGAIVVSLVAARAAGAAAQARARVREPS